MTQKELPVPKRYSRDPDMVLLTQAAFDSLCDEVVALRKIVNARSAAEVESPKP